MRRYLRDLWQTLRASGPDVMQQIAWFAALFSILPAMLSNILIPYYWPQEFLSNPISGPEIAHLNIWMVLAGLVLTVAFAVFRSRQFIVPAIVYIALLSTSYLTDPGSNYGLKLSYAVLSLGLVLHVAGSGRIRLITLALFVAAAYAFLARFSNFPLYAGLKIIEFVALVGLARYVIMFVRENYRDLVTVKRDKFRGFIGWTIFYWAPVLVLAISGIVLNVIYQNRVFDFLYEQQILLAQNADARDLRKDIHFTIDRRFDETAAAGTASIDGIDTSSEAALAAFPDNVVAQYDGAMPPQLIPGDPCPRGGWKNLIRIICVPAKNGVNSSFDDYKNRKRPELRSQAEQVRDAKEEDRAASIATTRQTMQETVAQSRATSHRLAEFGLNLMVVLNFILSIIFAFVLLKSLSIVISRILYNTINGGKFTLKPEGVVITKGRISRPRNRQVLTLRSTRPDIFHVVDRDIIVGGSPFINWPQPFSSALARIRHGCYGLSRLDLGKRQNPPPFLKLPPHQEFVVWHLRAGEKVVFDFRDFIAMNDQLKIETVFSARIATFCLARQLFVTQAVGPGTLILKTEGNAVYGTHAVARQAVSPRRIVAFNLGSSFSLVSEIGFRSIYLNDAHVSPRGSLVISDSRTGRGSGVIRRSWDLVKFLILPW